MGKHCTRQHRGLGIVLLLAWLLVTILILPETVLSGPPDQDQTFNLGRGDEASATCYAQTGGYENRPCRYRVNLPPGENLTVRVGEGPQGGCTWGVSMIQGSSYMGGPISSHYAGPNNWSDPWTWVIESGSVDAEIYNVGNDDGFCSGPFPHQVNIHFWVGGSLPGGDGPTSTPTPTLAPYQPQLPPLVEIWADPPYIVQGQCTTLHWRVENVREVRYEGQPIPDQGETRDCPSQTTTYELQIIHNDGSQETRTITVYVEEPITDTPTPQPTYTFTPWPTATPLPQPTPTPWPTFTSTPRPRPTDTPWPTATPERRPTATPVRRATSTPTRRPTVTPTPTSTPKVEPKLQVRPASEPRLLVVTHSKALHYYVGYSGAVGDTWAQVRVWLDDRYGPRNYDVLDLAEVSPDQVPSAAEVDRRIEAQWKRGRYWSIFVIGGHNVVPHAEGTNFTGDGDRLWTDDLYADFNGDWIPDTPLARLPDAGDINLLRAQLTRRGSVGSGGFVMAQAGRTYTEQFAAAANTRVIYSPPFNRVETVPSGVNSGFAYFDLLGHPDNTTWYGPDLNPAFTVSDARSSGVVVTMAGYGGFVPGCNGPGCPNIANIIPISFLRSGSIAFIGTTGVNYAIPVYEQVGTIGFGDDPIWEENYNTTETGIPAFTLSFLNRWGDTSDPLVAYYLAKVDMLRRGYGFFTNVNGALETKMGHSLVYYGVPSALTDCPACVPQLYKPVVPNRGADSTLTIDVERPLVALETGAAFTEGCGFLDCGCTARDSDNDGLSDALEWRLAVEFEPYLEFDEAERINPWDPYDFDIYYQVSPVSSDGNRGQLLLTWVLAYERDYGAIDRVSNLWEVIVDTIDPYVFEAHSGDTEMMRLRLAYEFDDPLLSVQMLGYEIKRHHDDPQPYPAVSGGGPYLYISRDKHAAYTSPQECANYTFEHFGIDSGIRFEECGGGPRGWASQFSPYLRSNHNVGEDGTAGTRHWARYTMTFNGFDLWTTKGPFCGNNSDCDRVYAPVSKVCLGLGLCKDALARFADKGAGVFSNKWHHNPAPIKPSWSDVNLCLK